MKMLFHFYMFVSENLFSCRFFDEDSENNAGSFVLQEYTGVICYV